MALENLSNIRREISTPFSKELEGLSIIDNMTRKKSGVFEDSSEEDELLGKQDELDLEGNQYPFLAGLQSIDTEDDEDTRKEKAEKNIQEIDREIERLNNIEKEKRENKVIKPEDINSPQAIAEKAVKNFNNTYKQRLQEVRDLHKESFDTGLTPLEITKEKLRKEKEESDKAQELFELNENTKTNYARYIDGVLGKGDFDKDSDFIHDDKLKEAGLIYAKHVLESRGKNPSEEEVEEFFESRAENKEWGQKAVLAGLLLSKHSKDSKEEQLNLLEKLKDIDDIDDIEELAAASFYDNKWYENKIEEKREHDNRVNPMSDFNTALWKKLDDLGAKNFFDLQILKKALSLFSSGIDSAATTALKIGDWFSQGHNDDRASEYIREKYEAFEKKKIKELKGQIASLEKSDPEAAKEFKESLMTFSDGLTEYSNAHKIAKYHGKTVVTELSDEEKIDKALKSYIIQTYGSSEALINKEDEFWQNREAEFRTFGETLTNTGGQFITTLSADVMALIGVVTAGVEDAYKTTTGQEGSGFDNAILRYAANLQETGVFNQDSKEFKELKELGISKYDNAKSVEEEDSYLSLIDISDAIGQYGFTAATSLISFGSTALTSSIAKTTTKAAAKRAAGKLATKLAKKGITRELTIAERRAILESAKKLGANVSKYGNLVGAGMVGTSEGALEAISTYDTMLKDAEQMASKFDDDINKYNDYGNILVRATEELGEEAVSKMNVSQLYEWADYKISKAKEAKEAFLKRAELDAQRAGRLNLFYNSMINGATNILFKDILLAPGARQAINEVRGIDRLREILNYTNGKFEVNSKTLWNVVKNGTKTSFGEALEEGLQTISDNASRALFTNDLENYFKVAYDKKAREALQFDWSNAADITLNSILGSITDKETIKSAIMGALSTGIGGFNPAGLISLRNKSNRKWSDYAAVLMNSSYLASYNEVRGNIDRAKSLARMANTLLEDKEVAEIFDNLGTAEGFKILEQQALSMGDRLTAKDSSVDKLGAVMTLLEILEHTNQAESFKDIISARKDWKSILDNDVEFTSDSNNTDVYIGDNETVKSAINQFRNESNGGRTSMTDKQILERLVKNAEEFDNFHTRWSDNGKIIDELFKDRPLDVHERKLLIRARMMQEDANTRTEELGKWLNTALSNTNLLDEQRKSMQKSGLSEENIQSLISGKKITSDSGEVQLFSAGDIANMSIQDRAFVIQNRSKYSTEQQQAIQDFIDITRQNILNSDPNSKITTEEVINNYLDHATLETRANMYNKYLDDAIKNNSKVLFEAARKARINESERILKQLYREKLDVKDGETPLDTIDRLDKEITALEKEGRVEDVSILRGLINRTPWMSDFRDKQVTTNKIALSYINSLKGKVEIEGLTETLLVLQLLNPDKTIEQLQKMMVDNPETVKELLKGNLAKSLLEKSGINVSKLNTDVLTNMIKKALDNYVVSNKSITVEVTPAERTSPSPSAASETVVSKPNTETKPAPTSVTDVNNEKKTDEKDNDKKEDGSITISTAKDVSTEVRDWLQQHGYTNAVLNMSAGTEVAFSVIKIGDSFYTVALIESIAPGGIKVGSKEYNPIGIITEEQSAQLTSYSAKAMLNGEESTLLTNENGEVITTQTRISDISTTSKQHDKDSIPIKDFESIQNNEVELNKWLNSFLEDAIIDFQNGTIKYNNRFIDIDTTPIFDYKIEGATIREVLNSEVSLEDKIKILQKNPLFANIIQAWKTSYYNANIENVDSKELYNKLIGNFIYLGTTYDNNSAFKNLEFSLNKETSTIEIKKGGEPLLNIELNNKNPLEVLISTFTALSNNEALDYGNPQVSFREIKTLQNQGKDLDSYGVRIKSHLMTLLKLGAIKGQEISTVDRRITVGNPFHKEQSSQRKVESPVSNMADTNPVVSDKGPSISEAAEKAAANKMSEGKNIIDDIRTNSIAIEEARKKRIRERKRQEELAAKEGRELEKEERTSSSVTSIENALEKNTIEKPSYEGVPEINSKVSTTLGTVVDKFIRTALNYAKNKDSVTAKEILEQAKAAFKSEGLNGNIPNFSNIFGLMQFANQLAALHNFLSEKVWSIETEHLRMSGFANVSENGVKIGTLPLSGELDLIAVDKEGKLHIIDFKTTNSIEWSAVNPQTKELYRNQISIYASMIKANYPNAEFGECYILPIGYTNQYKVEDDMSVKEGSLVIENFKSTIAPKFLLNNSGLEKIDLIEDTTLNIEALDEESKKIIKRDTQVEDNPIPTAPESTTDRNDKIEEKEESEDDNTGTWNDSNLDDDELEFSRRRSQEEIDDIDFMNRRMQPVSKLTLFQKARKLFKRGDILNTQELLQRDLANTFFNGNVLKLKMIIGDIDIASRPKTVHKMLTDYFRAQEYSYSSVSLDIVRKYFMRNLLVELMDGKITEDEFQRRADDNGYASFAFTDYIEYRKSEDKEAFGKSVKERYEALHALNEDEYISKLKALESEHRFNRKALRFLESDGSLSRMNTRFKSIKDKALISKYSERSEYQDSTIEEIISGKTPGDYNAINLLNRVIRKSSNKDFRILGAHLLNILKDNEDLIVNIQNIERSSQEDSITEGAYSDNNISITLDKNYTFDQFERVLLHELLHSVAHKLITDDIIDLYEEYKSELSKNYTEEELNKIYGMTSVNEFISEFLTNSLFRNQLDELIDSKKSFKSKILSALLPSGITKNSTKSLLKILNTVKEVSRTHTVRESVNKTFSTLTKEQQERLNARGITELDFNEMTSLEQEKALKCCK